MNYNYLKTSTGFKFLQSQCFKTAVKRSTNDLIGWWKHRLEKTQTPYANSLNVINNLKTKHKTNLPPSQQI